MHSASKNNFRVTHCLGEAPEGWEGEEGFIDIPKLDKFVSKNFSDDHKVRWRPNFASSFAIYVSWAYNYLKVVYIRLNCVDDKATNTTKSSRKSTCDKRVISTAL